MRGTTDRAAVTRRGSDPDVAVTPDVAVANTHEWFERHSGWAPPDEGTLEEWRADGVCRCPDECLVVYDGCCKHGLASWSLVLSGLREFDAGVRRGAPRSGS